MKRCAVFAAALVICASASAQEKSPTFDCQFADGEGNVAHECQISPGGEEFCETSHPSDNLGSGCYTTNYEPGGVILACAFYSQDENIEQLVSKGAIAPADRSRKGREGAKQVAQGLYSAGDTLSEPAPTDLYVYFTEALDAPFYATICTQAAE